MPSICLYFRIHQPFLQRHFTFFDIDRGIPYEDEDRNRYTLSRLAETCYLPMNRIMVDLIRTYGGDFKIAFLMSGLVLEQMERYSRAALDSFKRLADTGCVEFLGETYYHSMSFLFSPREFKEQADLHRDKIRTLFGQDPVAFHNTETVYSNELAKLVEKMGFRAIVTDGTENVLGGRSPNHVYTPPSCRKIRLLIKNCRLSDDISFMFSEREGPEYPAGTWIGGSEQDGKVANLVMDYAIFEKDPKVNKGKGEFLRNYPGLVLKKGYFRFQLPREVIVTHKSVGQLDVPHPQSSNDLDRNPGAWGGNAMQRDAIRTIYGMEAKLRKKKNGRMLETWRKLQAVDYFQFMGANASGDGQGRGPANPYPSPYDAYVNYMNILADFNHSIEETRSQDGR